MGPNHAQTDERLALSRVLPLPVEASIDRALLLRHGRYIVLKGSEAPPVPK